MELDILSQKGFEHPNIVRFLGSKQTFSTPWLLLGYEDQGSLHSILCSGELLSWEHTLSLVVSMLNGRRSLTSLTAQGLL